MRTLLAFPDPVNESAARVVAAGAFLVSAAAIGLQAPWLTAVIAYGFLARVIAGPKLSPLGQLATKVIVPGLSLPARPAPGPPKRFAQAIGLVFSGSAAVLALGLGLDTAAFAVLGALAFFAALEAALGLCVGCKVFALLIRARLVPSGVCERCSDIGVARAHSA
jgi:hypothetical protein